MSSRRHWQPSKALALTRAVGVTVAIACAASPAQADDSAYCRKVRARAGSEAALLFGPTLRLEGVKLPTTQTMVLDPTLGTPISAPSNGNEYQLRASVSVSPLYMYKGLRVLGVGSADCEQHAPAVAALEVLAQDKDFGRLPALRKQVAYLEGRRASWESLLATSEERFRTNVTTLQQAEDIRTRIVDLDRQRALLDAEVKRLENLGFKDYAGSLADLAGSVDDAAMEYERRASNVRKLDAWDVRITGGYIPPVFGSNRSDAYGVVALSYNLGGPWQHSAETRYLDARKDELHTSPTELSARLATFRGALRNELASSRRELAIVSSRITVLAASREALQASDAVKASQALALLELELVSAESERVYLAELVGQLSRF